VIIEVSVVLIPDRLCYSTFEPMTEAAIPGPKLPRFSIRISESRMAYACDEFVADTYIECDRMIDVRAVNLQIQYRFRACDCFHLWSRLIIKFRHSINTIRQLLRIMAAVFFVGAGGRASICKVYSKQPDCFGFWGFSR
jgi:hypothetical protein